MLPNEGVKEMYISFIDIINNHKSLQKVYSNEEMVMNLLKSLLRNQWGAKVMTIEEDQKLKILKLEDLVGKVLAFEIHLQEEQKEMSDRG